MTSLPERVLSAIAAVIIVAMVALMNVELISRYIFGYSTRVSEEYSSYMFCAATVAGFYPALMRGRFLRITALLSLVSLKVRAVWEVILGLISTGFSAVVAFQTWDLFAASREFGSISDQYSQTPLMYPQLVLFLGWALLSLGMLLRGLRLGFDLWRNNTLLIAEEADVLE